MNLFASGLAAVAILLSAPAALGRQDTPRPAETEPHVPPVISTVELSFIAPVNNDVLDPVGLARFQLSLESLMHGTLDDATRGAPALVKGALFVGVMFFDRTIAKVGHEYGHIAVFNRAGYYDFLLTVGDSAPQPLTFREVFINSIVPQRPLSVQLTEEDALDAVTRFSPEEHEELTTASYAGGLNQEQVHLNLYRERVFRHQFGFFDASTYLIEALSTLAYSAEEDWDLDGYVDSLDRSGITTSITMVKAISMARFLSGTAVSAGIGFYKVMAEDRYDGFAPRVIGKGKEWTVLWPEFESFLTRRGPTVRSSLPLRIGGALLLPGLEAAIAEEGLEFEGGVEASRPLFPWLDARGSFYVGHQGGTWGELGIALKPDPVLSILVSWHAASGYTFHRDVYGETLDFIDGSEQGFQLGLSALFKF